MTRRTHACLGCFDSESRITGFFSPKNRRTRHKDQVCSWCRRRGVYMRDGHLHVPIEINWRGGRAA